MTLLLFLLQVVTNGYMTFGKSYVEYWPFEFPSSDVHDFSIVAPFFFEVDICRAPAGALQISGIVLAILPMRFILEVRFLIL